MIEILIVSALVLLGACLDRLSHPKEQRRPAPKRHGRASSPLPELSNGYKHGNRGFLDARVIPPTLDEHGKRPWGWNK